MTRSLREWVYSEATRLNPKDCSKVSLSCAQSQVSDIVALEVKSELPLVAHCALHPRTGSSCVRQPPATFAEGSTNA